MINRCEACQGKKKVMGLGMLLKDCSACNGVGYINNVDKVKRERKPKVVEEPAQVE